MNDLEIEIKDTSARLFDLYESKRNSGLLSSKQSYEERKKAYIDNSLKFMRVSEAWHGQGELEHKPLNKKDIADKFDDWLYKNYYIGNGKTLVSLIEMHGVVEQFLKDMGLPLDIEF